MPQIIDHESASGDHLQAVGADHLQRALDQLRGDAAAAQRGRRLGVGDDNGPRRQPVIRERDATFDIKFKPMQGFVVADRGSYGFHLSRS